MTLSALSASRLVADLGTGQPLAFDVSVVAVTEAKSWLIVMTGLMAFGLPTARPHNLR
jgi:hypothetical protein